MTWRPRNTFVVQASTMPFQKMSFHNAWVHLSLFGAYLSGCSRRWLEEACIFSLGYHVTFPTSSGGVWCIFSLAAFDEQEVTLTLVRVVEQLLCGMLGVFTCRPPPNHSSNIGQCMVVVCFLSGVTVVGVTHLLLLMGSSISTGDRDTYDAANLGSDNICDPIGRSKRSRRM